MKYDAQLLLLSTKHLQKTDIEFPALILRVRIEVNLNHITKQINFVPCEWWTKITEKIKWKTKINSVTFDLLHLYYICSLRLI